MVIKKIILVKPLSVRVITPSLNKSFKFQSEWPYNNSQVYLLDSIIEDLVNDKDRTYVNKDGFHIFTSKVNYPNNKKLVSQSVYIDDKLNIKEVQVLDSNGNLQMKMIFTKIDLKANFKADYFKIDESLDSAFKPEETETTTKIEDVIYPMYLPVNTHLTDKKVVNNEDGDRLILTFDGDNPFLLIEEPVSYQNEHTIVPVQGDMAMLIDTIAVISDNSVSWYSNGVEYYVISNVMNLDELLEVARSISVIPVSK